MLDKVAVRVAAHTEELPRSAVAASVKVSDLWFCELQREPCGIDRIRHRLFRCNRLHSERPALRLFDMIWRRLLNYCLVLSCGGEPSALSPPGVQLDAVKPEIDVAR